MALDAEKWATAERAEIDNHLTNGSWTEIDFCDGPSDRKRLVRMTWAYTTKRSGKKKARLC
eukprot:2952662-Prymnesium_polylepis.2